MAASILQAPLPSVHHHYPNPLNAAHLGLVADPWNTSFCNFQLFADFPPANSSTLSNFSPIAIATDEISPLPEMSPRDPPSSSPSRLRQCEYPPRLRPQPTSPVEIQGKLVRRRPRTYVGRVAKLRNPAPATTSAAPTTNAVQHREDSSMSLDYLNSTSQESPQLQAPAASQGSLAARRRRRAPNSNFTPPRLTRTQPEGLWAPLTGNARAIDAAFRDRSPPPPSRVRRSSRRALFEAPDDFHFGSPNPVPATPKPRLARRESTLSEPEAENERLAASQAENVAEWETQPFQASRPSRRLSRCSGGKYGPGGDSGLHQQHSYLSPELIPGADEPLRSFSEELSRLSISSSDEEEMSAPPPPPRRRRGLTRSSAGRFKMGEAGNLVLDEI